MTNIEHVRKLAGDALAKFGGYAEALAWLQLQVDAGTIDEAVADLFEAGCFVPHLASMAAAMQGGLARDQEMRKLRQWIEERDVLNQALQQRVAELAEQVNKARAQARAAKAPAAKKAKGRKPAKKASPKRGRRG